jgi:hypothetical protein
MAAFLLCAWIYEGCSRSLRLRQNLRIMQDAKVVCFHSEALPSADTNVHLLKGCLIEKHLMGDLLEIILQGGRMPCTGTLYLANESVINRS